MSSRCSIIYDDDKHIYLEGCDETIDFIWHKEKFETKYGEPNISIDELFTLVSYFTGYTGCKPKFEKLINEFNEKWKVR